MKRTPTEQRYLVTIKTDESSGLVIDEMWKLLVGPELNSLVGLHRDHGPALIIRDPLTGIVTYEGFYRNNGPHRLDGPAEIERDPETGVITREAWWKNGGLHRDSGPAFIKRNSKTGKVTRMKWYRDGAEVEKPESPAPQL